MAPTRLPFRPSSPGQDEGEFGKHVLLSAVRAADHHGRRSVEDQPGGQLAVLVELAYLRFIEPGGDVPVDVPGVVAFDVRPQPGEVKTSTSSRGAIPALDAPVEPAYDPPLQPVQQAVRPLIMFGGQGVVPLLIQRSWLQHHVRHGHGAQHADEDAVGVEVVGQRFVRQHDPVAQYVEGHFVDVVGEHVVPAAQERERPAAQDEARSWPAGWRRRSRISPGRLGRPLPAIGWR